MLAKFIGVSHALAFFISAERSAGKRLRQVSRCASQDALPSMEKTAMSIKTKGTELFFVYQNSNGYNLVKFGCPKGIGGLGGAKSQIPETCLDSLEMEFGPGMGTPGAITVNTDIDWAKVSHQDLIHMDQNDTIATWIVGFSDGTTLPTVNNTTGVVTYPSTRSFVNFLGYIADLPLDIQINANVVSAVSIQRTGAKTYHFKA